MHLKQRSSLTLVMLTISTLIARCAFATTKGLNQIVTPDIQPMGQLSLSLQMQDNRIGNALEAQLELGITKRFEAAYFQGFNPGDSLLGIEESLIDKHPWRLSTGFINWSPVRGGIQPFLEGGYYHSRSESIAGIIDVGNQVLPMLGYGYQLNNRLLLQADFQGGKGNFSTLGVTYSATPNLSINPSLYISNDNMKNVYAYLVVSWTFEVFKGR